MVLTSLPLSAAKGHLNLKGSSRFKAWGQSSIFNLQSSIYSPTIQVEVDLESLEKIVRNAFVEKFGQNVIKEVRASKYPHMYSVVVWVTKKDIRPMLDLCIRLQEEFERQGLSVGVSTREVR